MLVLSLVGAVIVGLIACDLVRAARPHPVRMHHGADGDQTLTR